MHNVVQKQTVLKRFKTLLFLGALALVSQINPRPVAADTVGPALTIQNPLPNESVYTLKISEGQYIIGGASDIDGINRVAVVIRRYSDGAYWTGNNWQLPGVAIAATLTPVSATGVRFEVYNGPPHSGLTVGGTYLIQIEAVDQLGNRTQAQYNVLGGA